MIRNYNGRVNRSLLRDLEKICNVHKENTANLSNALEQDGKVTICENLDWFGQPDELSHTITLENKEEVDAYLRKDLCARIDNFLTLCKPDSDYLLDDLLLFIKENGVYPSKDEMVKLEQTAESKRLSNLPEDYSPDTITEQTILKEILELSEEIFETRRETSPNDIWRHVEPYGDELRLESKTLSITIEWDRYYGHKDSTAYSCKIFLNNVQPLNELDFRYQLNGIVHVYNNFNELDPSTITENLIIAHKGISELAITEGIEFTSEIDYQKFTTK